MKTEEQTMEHIHTDEQMTLLKDSMPAGFSAAVRTGTEGWIWLTMSFCAFLAVQTQKN